MSGALRDVRLGPFDLTLERRPDGIVHACSPHPLGDYPARLTERLEHWAEWAPERTFLAKRGPDGAWRRLSYAETLNAVRRLGQALLERGLSAERPLVILSGNDLEHALLGLAALYAGIPYAPISPAYSLISRDFGKLRHILALITPGLVFAADGDRYRARSRRRSRRRRDRGHRANRRRDARPRRSPSCWRREPTRRVERARRRIGPDTDRQVPFHLGLDRPAEGGDQHPAHAVQPIRRMIATTLRLLQDEPPIILDWAPWNHTAGGNHNFKLVLYNGGTLYIDDGRPTPAEIEATVRNLREIAPTWYFNVPKGFDALMPYLEDDALLRERFFKGLRLLFYAGARLAQHVWEAFDAIALATTASAS